MQATYQSRRVLNNVPLPMEVKIVGIFPVILVKLATPPLPPQTKLASISIQPHFNLVLIAMNDLFA